MCERRSNDSGHDLFFEELLRAFGLQRELFAVYRNADAVLAVAHAKLARKLYLVLQLMIGDQTLQLLHDLTGTLQVAAASDTDGYLYHNRFAPYFHGSGVRIIRLRRRRLRVRRYEPQPGV
jgi:hypothetical protein